MSIDKAGKKQAQNQAVYDFSFPNSYPNVATSVQLPNFTFPFILKSYSLSPLIKTRQSIFVAPGALLVAEAH
jgi:hypothetical protein